MTPLSIVVADDVEEIQLLLREWLGRLGHRVTCASSGDQVTKLLKEVRVDVVITDVLMPDGDGLEVLLELKRAQPWAKVLAISGGGAYMQAVDCLNVAKGLGAHGVLMKPFDRRQLIDAVRRVSPVPAAG